MDARSFILERTRLQRPSFLPELQLYLADEVITFWKLVEAEQCSGVAPPLWAFAWVGGLAVARYVIDTPLVVAEKRVLDFASGSGLCGIAAMCSGARYVLACDLDPWAETAVALNAEANGVEIEFTGLDLLDADIPDVDIILAGDVCYEEPMADRVMRWLQKGHAAGISVLIGDPGRAHFPRDTFRQLTEYDVPTTRELEDRDIKRTGVYTFPAM